MTISRHGMRLLLCASFLVSSVSIAAPAGKENPPVTEGKPASKAGGDSDNDPGYVVRSSTRIDFNETNIEGKMKAPEGFYLQGRRAQRMQHLLKLRQDFKKELEGSGEAAQTEYK